MIKKSFIVFILVLLLHIIIRDMLKPDIEITQVPWQANQQIGQRYLYSTDTIDDVFLGSSISFHLELEGTQLPISNLAFTGESAHKGISLIIARGELSGLYPKRIYIETNTLSNYTFSTFESSMFNPFLIYPRKYIPSLRDGKQPLPWMATLAEKYVILNFIPHRYQLFEEYLKYEAPAGEKKPWETEAVPNERFKYTELAKKDEVGVEKRLTKGLNKLIENGCEPIFVDIPISDKYRLSHEYSTIREVIERNYPASNFLHIGYSLDSAYQTYDGLHLSAADNPRYSAYLRSVIDSITCAKGIR